jgi:2-C-methyl-D-erythritol 4-phosphate cytidylyltransferase
VTESKRAERRIAVVLAGGGGRRSGLSYPKQFAKVAGRAVLEHTVDLFERHPAIDEVLVVSHPDHVDRVWALSHANGWTKLARVVRGGEDRFGSTWSALQALADEPPGTRVLFHDGVRPLLPAGVIDACLDALERYHAVDVVVPTADTIVRVDDEGLLRDIPPRHTLRRGQTPQGFRLGSLTAAYERALAEGRRQFTCDCGVFAALSPNLPIATVEGATTNLKITHPEDLFLADKLFQSRGTDSEQLPSSRALEGQVMVVFGGSQGIGKAIVCQAAARGATTVSHSRGTTGVDVGDRAAVREALRAALAEHGHIDHVVNTAALLDKKALVNVSDLELQAMVSANLLGAFHVAMEAFPHLRSTKGSLLNFTSSSYTRGRAFYSVYSATKAAVVNLTQALAEEWADDGVRVNCVNPERTRTPMRLRNFGDEPPDSLLEAGRVAEASLRTLSSSRTGQVIDVRREKTALA